MIDTLSFYVGEITGVVKEMKIRNSSFFVAGRNAPTAVLSEKNLKINLFFH